MKRFIFTAACCAALHSIKAQQSFAVRPDTVKAEGMELVVRNATRHIPGFLFNNGNGKTGFKTIGNALEFAVGASGAPQAGDSVYTNTTWKGRYIKIWRNGLLICTSCPGSTSVDTSLGKIIFRPALVAAEKIYIEALNFSDFTFHPFRATMQYAMLPARYAGL
ncbi:hypothetical protein [Chitinophaga rhizosphaerae]|uniref:hypothetical protein n=1 Tax=Chitinophaga rhizosphaerae TaxID=1864947 RepID=UPI000F8136F1|nr:hypothetical protein [Chitinophaga rhizosphaerae]